MMSRKSAEPVDLQAQSDDIATPRYPSTSNKGYVLGQAFRNLRVPDIGSDQSYGIGQCLKLGVYLIPHGPTVRRHEPETSSCVTLPRRYGYPLILPNIQL